MQPSTNGHETSLIYIVGRVNQGIRREMTLRLAEWNLSVKEYTTLSVLNNRPGLSNAQLARRALVTPQSMIEILGKLEKRRLLNREADPSHARILRAALTPEGKKLLADADPGVQAIQDQMLAGVPPADQRTVVSAMLTAMDSLSRQSERRRPGG